MTIFISFLDSYLDSSIVRRATLGQEAQGGVKPHHVVPLEAVLHGSHQQGLVSVSIPPGDWRKTLAYGWHQGQITKIISH